jgi:LPXTG-motif cell wall-anchored protein
MDQRTAQNMSNVAKKGNNNMLYAGVAGAALVGYYFYKKRQGDVANVGDAAAKSGAAVGRGMERTGDAVGGRTGAHMKDEGRGFENKK